MNCIAPPLVYPTTSASVLVAFNRTARPGCADEPGLAQTADSLFVVLARHAGSEHWAELEQLGEGQQLPVELGGLRCAAGCAFRVRWANKHQATSSETDLVHTPPPATKPSSKVYALRIEFFVSPPLPPPVGTAAVAFAAGVASLLHMKSERVTVAEASASGRFLLLDLLEQDVHAYVKGKRLPEIMPLLRARGGEVPRRRGAPVAQPGQDVGEVGARAGCWARSGSAATAAVAAAATFTATTTAAAATAAAVTAAAGPGTGQKRPRR